MSDIVMSLMSVMFLSIAKRIYLMSFGHQYLLVTIYIIAHCCSLWFSIGEFLLGWMVSCQNLNFIFIHSFLVTLLTL